LKKKLKISDSFQNKQKWLDVLLYKKCSDSGTQRSLKELC